MRCKEVAGSTRIPAAAPARPELAAPVENAHSPARGVGARSGRARPPARVEAQLGNVDEPPTVDENLTRPDHVGPFGEVVAVRREELDPAVLAVGHVYGPLPAYREAVG